MKQGPNGITWCDYTFNPWIGCTMISEGCVHCYADGIERRFGRGGYDAKRERVRTSEAYWHQPHLWNEQAYRDHVRRRVFVGSMCDVFDEHAPEGALNDLLVLISQCRGLDWLLLTKRPQNCWEGFKTNYWGNVWLGVSVENQKRAEERIPGLRAIPGVGKRFLSVEPLIGPVDLARGLQFHFSGSPYPIHWVIVGGESGPHCRKFEADWAREIKSVCFQRQIAFFMKQLGGHPNKRHWLEDLPEDLRIREFPS